MTDCFRVDEEGTEEPAKNGAYHGFKSLIFLSGASEGLGLRSGVTLRFLI